MAKDGSKIKLWALKIQDGDANPANVAAMKVLCGMTSFNQEMTRQSLDKTSFCSNGVKEYFSGLLEESASLDGFLVIGDIGQAELDTAITGGEDALCLIVVAYTGDPTDGTLLFPCKVESRSISTSVGERIGLSYSLKVSGASEAGPTS